MMSHKRNYTKINKDYFKKITW